MKILFIHKIATTRSGVAATCKYYSFAMMAKILFFRNDGKNKERSSLLGAKLLVLSRSGKAAP